MYVYEHVAGVMLQTCYSFSIMCSLVILNSMLKMRERMALPEANNGTLLADVTLGLVFCSLRSSHSVQDRKPNHRLGFQTHPINKLPGLQFHLVSNLGVKAVGVKK